MQQKTSTINHLKLTGLNLGRSLVWHGRELKAYKHFVMVIGEGKVKRAHVIITVSRHAGKSIHMILKKLDRTASNVFRPLNYQEQDFQRVFLS